MNKTAICGLRAALVIVFLLILLALGALILVGNYFYTFALDPNAKGGFGSAAGIVDSEYTRWLLKDSRDVSLISDDGLELHAYRVDGSVPHRYAVLCHGYQNNATGMASYGKHLFDLGYTVLLPDARGHGESEGDYIGMGWPERRDVVRWCQQLIAEDPEAEIVLSHLLKSFSGILHRDVTLYIAVPSDITQVEKRAFFQVMRGKIGAGRIRLIDKGIADAVSAELPVLSSRGHMIVNIGGDTTEISVIASGKIILSQTLKIGGRRLDEDISTMVRRKFNLSIGQKSAEALKNNLAFMINGPRLEQKVFGIHTLSGLPKSDMIPSLAVSVAIIDSVDMIVEAISSIFNRVPPQLMKDITREGIYLSGGVSMIQNLPEYIRKELGIPIHHIQDPKNSTVRGLVEIINNKDLRQCTYTLKDLAGMR